MMKSASSAAGTSACTSSQPSQPSFAAKPRICPRRPVSSRWAAGLNSAGTLTVTACTGSSITGSAFASPSCIAMRVAVAKAMSLLSTEWKPPSSKVTATSTTGWPSGPLRVASSAAWPTAGMKRRGTAPPTTFSSKWNPAPRGRGAIWIFTSANCPWPPVCRFSRACLHDGMADGLPIGDRRAHRAQLHPAAGQPIQRRAQVDLALAGEDGRAAFLVLAHRQRRVFFRQALQRGGKAHLVLAVLRRDGHRVDGRRRHREREAPARRGSRRSSRPPAARGRRSRPPRPAAPSAPSPPGKRWMPPVRCPSSAAPSRSGPRQSRTKDRRPAWPAWSVRNTCASGAPSGAIPRRAAVSAAWGTSCRSAFHKRWMPLLCSAAPSSTLITAPLASPSCSGR